VTSWPADQNSNSLVVPPSLFDGVPQLSISTSTRTSGCSGVLLSTGLHVLTAAHCVPGTATSATATFHTAAGNAVVSGSKFTVQPGWDGNVAHGNDLAIITLDQKAPVAGYDLYRSLDLPAGKLVELAGYGRTGNGETGSTLPNSALRWGTNTFDVMDATIAGAPYLFDFDNNTEAQDTLGSSFYNFRDPVTGQRHLGTGNTEVLTASGDSGGPSFIDGMLAGIHSFIASPGMPFDFDSTPLDGTYGELGGDTRVAFYAAWIDTVVRPVPEPQTGVLTGAGLLALLALVHKRRQGRFRS
jgi:secreted trypsin-like serine protease